MSIGPRNCGECWERVDRKLEAIEQKIDAISELQTSSRISIARLEVKSSIWGMIGGAIIAIASHLMHGKQ